jgi:hypothetical protein
MQIFGAVTQRNFALSCSVGTLKFKFFALHPIAHPDIKTQTIAPLSSLKTETAPYKPLIFGLLTS